MGKLIAAINMTLDGFCDHTAMVPDEETHQYFNDLLRDADALLYGRITYQLMEGYWPAIVQNPTGAKVADEFAVLIDDIPKIVFSRTLQRAG
jgi:dihydrofolate reductase